MKLSPRAYRFLADCMVTIHAGYVAYVILGMVAITAGLALRKTWARNPWLRLSHFACIAVVAGESWLGRKCPLTLWENRLRILGGQRGHTGSFIGSLMHRFTFYEAPPWVFSVVYTLFGAAVLLALILAPPRFAFRPRERNGTP